jgi:CYTH domain-containing protein
MIFSRPDRTLKGANMVTVIAIPGGPLSGKDACQPFVLQRFGDRGCYPLYATEAATLHMAGNLHPSKLSERTFQRSIIGTMQHLEDTNIRAATESCHPNALVFCNRGIPDCLPYSSSIREYRKTLKDLGLGNDVEVRDRRYKAAIFLRSLAYDQPDLYEKLKSGNPHRRENVDEARIMDEKTLQAWVGHPHLRILDNSTDWEGKLKRLEKEICGVLGMPVPLEIEKKYLCAPIDLVNIPVPVQKVDIEQLYLFSRDPGNVLRVRQRGQYGKHVYFVTEKRDVGAGVRQEVEHFISREQYEWSLRFQLPGTRIVKKSRHCFVYENQYFELDVIPIGRKTLHLLEIELTEETQQPKLPPFLKIIGNVTDDPRYTNRAMANLSWKP